MWVLRIGWADGNVGSSPNFRMFFQDSLIIESDSFNAIARVSSLDKGLWKFQFYPNEIKCSASFTVVVFQHLGRLANYMADSLAKQWLLGSFLYNTSIM